MKTLLFILFTFSSCLSLGQNGQDFQKNTSWSIEEKNVVFKKIIKVDSVDRDKLFNLIIQYFTFNYNNGENVIQIQDKDLGVIVGKGKSPNINSIIGIGA